MKRLYYDFEVYPNFWLVVFKDENGHKISLHSRMDYKPSLQRLKSNIKDYVFIGFNNNRYDTVMLNYLLKNFSFARPEQLCETMFEMSNEIILQNEYFKKVMGMRKIEPITYEMDVSNFVMVGTGLKELGCRLHHPKLETLPFRFDTLIQDDQIPKLAKYCENDVDITMKVANELVADKISVVLDVIDYWKLDKSLMNSTLSNIVEVALVDENIRRNEVSKWRYKAPLEFKFRSQQFKDIEETYKGLILEPNYSFSFSFELDRMEVTVAMGGAHGAVKKSYFENIIDIDVNQFYPIMLYQYDFLPNTIKDKEIYGKLIEDKKRYSETNDPRVSAVKESINAIYGRMGYNNSKLYAPDKLYQTTITGQLLQLRLIEDLRSAGYEVIYLNTDGLSILDNGDDSYKTIVEKWANEFNVEYKTAYFKRAYYRDVNNFVAEDENGELKRKGDLSTKATHKNSAFARASVNAVVEHLIHGKDIREYIKEQNDLRDFVLYHKYNSDIEVYLESKGSYQRLSNVVRYYHSNNRYNSILHKKAGDETYANRKNNKNVHLLPNFEETHGVVHIPSDLDKEQYVKIAFDTLYKVTGNDVNDNPYIENILKKLAETT